MSKQKKAVLGVVLVGVLYLAMSKLGYLPGSMTIPGVHPTGVDLSSQNAAVQTPDDSKVQAVALPSTEPAQVRGPEIKVEVIPWNAEMGHHFAVGGAVTMKGSLMEKYGVRVRVERKDDDMVALDMLLKTASEMAKGNDEPTGDTVANFVIDMGDAMAQYLASCNKGIKKLGLSDDYRCEIIGAVGYSRGEDKCAGQAEWKDNPEAAKGKVIAAQLKQGDWNVCQYWIEQQKDLKTNPVATTWDPDMVNWYSTDDFAKATEAYVGRTCSDYDEVHNGKKTGKTVNRCVDGVATWTPGDVDAAKKRGFTTLLSTKDNPYQMPATIIGIHKWNVQHSKLVENYLRAALEGGQQVRKFDAALQRAARASYAIYRSETPGYWLKYYKGVVEPDKNSNPVSLGGSTVMSLADNAALFGLGEGTGGSLASSQYNASYTGFGKIVSAQYPRDLPTFPPIEQAVNLQFLSKLLAEQPTTEKPELVEFSPGDVSEKVAAKDYSITFDTGKATFTPAALAVLDRLYNTLLIGGGLTVEIDGHTDNVGSPLLNQDLSERRAAAVADWMRDKAPAFFSKGRVTVKGFGDTKPVAPNETAEGRAKNRRVSVILGSRG